MRFVKPKCYAFVADAPKTTSLRDAAHQFNTFISEKNSGLVLYHDHFVDQPGAFAIFYVESESELEDLETHQSLKDWNVKVHPLTFTEKPVEMLYQTDFTMGIYRGQRLRDLVKSYIGSDYEKNVDDNVGKGQ
ncbi:MAG TPA: hypothetical protein VFE96_05270 [Candidatus Bathyarchaeia archaeon]|jgi:hypothetical protein|nr:hypothetical protein [Candidatus Bathyarchaeia archaeon]